MDPTRSTSDITWRTKGRGLYTGKTFWGFYEEIKNLFERQRGYFSRCFGVVRERTPGIRFYGTFFRKTAGEDVKAVYGHALEFKKMVFAKEVDLDLMVIILAALRAYILAVPGKEIKEIDFTPLKGLESSEVVAIQGFRQAAFYGELKDWLRQASFGYLDPDSGRLMSYVQNPFYGEVVAWMEGHGVIKYVEVSAPPVIAPPVEPPPPPPTPPPSPLPSPAPQQGDLFGWVPPESKK